MNQPVSRKKSVVSSTVMGAVLLACASAVSAQRYDIAAVERYVNAELERQKVPGIALAIVSKGDVVLAKGFGLANVEHKVPVTAETIFQSGSPVRPRRQMSAFQGTRRQ